MSPTRERIRVLIADDHAIVRGGIRLLLEAQDDLEVVGEAADGVEAVRLARDADPDVVLLDLSMPGPGGTGVIVAIRRQAPRTRVLVVTMHEEDAYVRSALDAGAAGYVVKHVDGDALVAAIRSVHRGRILVNVSRPADCPTAAPSVPLSRRERQVLMLLAQGHSNRAVADRLELSVKTVETHRTRLGNKLGLRTRADLFRYSVETGILEPGAAAPPSGNRS
ncbi:MAG: response regulator transcription factor [Gemmatimonadales bacterium]|nr:response regulator transcription factor [Gemmatimonadales bacterium]